MSILGNQTRYQDAPYFEAVGDGATLSYALPWQPGYPGALIVVVGGVPQPVGAYQVSGYNLLLSSAPGNGARILVFGRGLRGVLNQPSAGSVGKAALAPDVSDALTLPVGTISYFAMQTAPAGWMECDGSLVSRVTYADLFSAIGTTFGAGDGATTFRLPDLRGEFLRGWDHGKGTDAGRVFGSEQSHAIQSHAHADWPIVGSSATSGAGHTAHSTGGGRTDATGYQVSGNVATETRPRNIAMLPCIKAYSATTNYGVVDLANLATEVAGKVRLSDLTGSNISLATSGYQKLPSGLIIQWGITETKTITSGVPLSVSGTLPIAFPNAFLSVSGSAGAAAARCTASIVPNGLAQVSGVINNESGVTLTFGIHYVAIGY